MRIGEVATKAGVTVKTVRHWEAEGLLPEVDRRGSFRWFDDQHLDRVRLIAHCREQGFSVPEVRQIISLLPQSGCPDRKAMREIVAARLLQVRQEIIRLGRVAEHLEATDAYLVARIP